MGLYERAEEVLALADHCDAGAPGKFDSLDSRVSGSTVHLYVVLTIEMREAYLAPAPLRNASSLSTGVEGAFRVCLINPRNSVNHASLRHSMEPGECL